MDRVDPLCQKPTPISELEELLENGCPNGLHPAALLSAAAVANDFAYDSRFLVSCPGPCPSVDDSKNGFVGRSRFNVGCLFARGPILSTDSLPGDHAPGCRFALPFDDLVLRHSLLARPAINVERAELWESVGSLSRHRTRRRPRIPAVMWSRFCGQVLGKRFVPKGPSDRSLAVYCHGMQETESVP